MTVGEVCFFCTGATKYPDPALEAVEASDWVRLCPKNGRSPEKDLIVCGWVSIGPDVIVLSLVLLTLSLELRAMSRFNGGGRVALPMIIDFTMGDGL